MLTVPQSPVAETADARRDALRRVYERVRGDLLSERNEQGYWFGRLCSSPLSTATAISALAIAEQHSELLADGSIDDSGEIDTLTVAYKGDLSELMLESLRWLAEQQNDDGGWGDTDRSESNLATTLLVLAAFRLTCVPARCPELEPRAEEYIRRNGGVAGLRKRYGKDKTFAAPILANCALAGIVPWRQVPTLPFELAAMPQRWFKWLRLPVVSYALPALVAIGLVKLKNHPPANPITGWLRRKVTDRCLALVKRMQPDSGGFLEATPLTSFVVMALAGAGYGRHPVVRRGVEFLLASAREEGAWPIDTDLACWNTSQALNALACGEDSTDDDARALDWLLACQHTERHPFTDADPGGWAWTNLSGGVPDADDTPAALLVLARVWQTNEGAPREQIASAVRQATRWLLDLQNADGGWPTFCRGWGKLPFDRSATDLTAHALRALAAWRDLSGWRLEGPDASQVSCERVDAAIEAGLRYLTAEQQSDGSWNPLWFGNEHRVDQANPVYGTGRVLRALYDLAARGVRGVDDAVIRRGVSWLLEQQHASGGWGNDPRGEHPPVASVEETAVALEALQCEPSPTPALAKRIDAAADWLAAAVDRDEHHVASPIGLYFAKLWYYERLYPMIFTVAALGAAASSQGGSRSPSPE